MRKRFFLLIIIYCWLSSAVYGLEVPKLQGYVNDYAGMISPAAKSTLEAKLKVFEQSDSNQIVVLTVPSLEGEDIRGFGIKVGDAWKIGQKGKDNGAILIVSKQERKIGIEVGYGLEGKLTDLMSGRIIDQVIKPKFRDGDFDGGFLAGVSAMIDGTRGEFKAEPMFARRGQKGTSPLFSIILFFAVFTIILGSLSRILSGVMGAIGVPTLTYLFASAVGFPILILMALFGFGAGFFLPALFSSGNTRRGSGHRGGGFFFGPGTGGFFSGGGGFGGGGGFSGGGGSFGGGGASGGW